MTLFFGKYTFSCTLTHDAILPEFKGSTFRGVFGRALKKTVCALKLQECGDCLLKEKCIYPVTFETHLLKPNKDQKTPDRPHPFVINPPLSTKTRYPEGSTFEFDLLLFGASNDNLPYYVYAFDQMGNIGIGRANKGKRGTFVLDHIRQNGLIIYDSENGKLRPEPEKELSIKVNGHKPGSDIMLKVSLLTPLRLKYENKLADRLPFHVFVRSLLRRASSLMEYYGNRTLEVDYTALVERAKEIKTVESDIHWMDWRRYSFRQKEDMMMGGMIGSVIYKGDIGEYLPLIEFCEHVNIGKQTVFGLGKMKFESLYQ